MESVFQDLMIVSPYETTPWTQNNPSQAPTLHGEGIQPCTRTGRMSLGFLCPVDVHCPKDSWSVPS